MNEKRIFSIDIIRGLCILAVIFLHINIHLHFDKTVLGETFSPVLLKTFLWSGGYGVTVFFVVSGFLITTTSIQRWGSLNQLHRRHFYWVRFSRIMPCLLAVLVLLIALDLFHAKGYVLPADRPSLMQTTFSILTFHLNWLRAEHGYLPGAWDVLWSLSVEETFYFFFPLICSLVKRERNFILLMLVFVILGPFSRTMLSHNEMWQDYAYLSNMDGIALGCLAGLWASKRNLSMQKLKWIFLLGIVLTGFIQFFRKAVFEWGLTTVGLNETFLEIGIALILIVLYERHFRGLSKVYVWSRIIAWFGKNSYEIYLTHMFVVTSLVGLFYFWHLPETLEPLWCIMLALLSGLVGAFVARFYSVPMNRFFRHYYPDVNKR